MSKRIFNPSKSRPATEKQTNRILRDTKRLAELRGLPKAGVEDLMKQAEGLSRFQASALIQKLAKVLPKAEPKAKAVPKGQMVNEVLAKAKTAGLEAAKTAPVVNTLNGTLLKGISVITFKGNNAVGKAWKSMTGGYTWNVPSESGSFDKLEAFTSTFTKVVKDAGFDVSHSTWHTIS